MKFFLRVCKILFRESSIDLTRCSERGAAEFHAALDHACSISPSHPFECLAGKVARHRRRGIFECDLVETQADLGIRGSSHIIEGTKVTYMGGG